MIRKALAYTAATALTAGATVALATPAEAFSGNDKECWVDLSGNDCANQVISGEAQGDGTGIIVGFRIWASGDTETDYPYAVRNPEWRLVNGNGVVTLIEARDTLGPDKEHYESGIRVGTACVTLRFSGTLRRDLADDKAFVLSTRVCK